MSVWTALIIVEMVARMARRTLWSAEVLATIRHLGLSRWRARRPYPVAIGQRLPGCDRAINGKPVARRGRKATGLTQVAGLPNRRWTVVVQRYPGVRLAVRSAITLGAVVAVLLSAAFSF